MIKEIRRKIQRQEYEYSVHAADQRVLRHIARKEVRKLLRAAPSSRITRVTNTAQVVWSWVTRKLGDGYTFSVLIRSGLGLRSLRFMSPILGSGLISRGRASNEL